MQPGSLEQRSVLHYDLLEKVGQGGMGLVYRARDRKLDRIVALKFLHSSVLESPAARSRFIHEALAVSRLNHRHIAVIHAIEESDEQVFLVFEYLPGGTLRSRLSELNARGELLGPAQVALYGGQIADALAHAHATGIIHRDVKPANIMFAHNGDLKIVDFGVSRQNDQTRLTQNGASVGTPLYMSPEQALGRDIDERSDIFSLGIVLFEMASGQPPFVAERPEGVVHKIVHEQAPRLRTSNAAFPAGLDEIIRRALEKDPGARYPRMLDLARDLGTFGESGRVHTDQLPTETLRLTPARGLQKRWLVALAFVLVVTGALLFKPLTAIYQKSPSNQFYLQGIAYLNRFYLPGNFDKAISSFNRAVQLSPRSAESYASLSETYLEKYLDTRDRQYLDTARSNADKAVALDRNSAEGDVATGMVLVASGDGENAVAAFRRALSKDAANVGAMRELATIYSSSGNMPEAESLYRQAIGLRPNDWNTWSQRGVAHYSNQNYEQAEKDFRTVTTLAPDSPAAHRNLGAVAMALGNFGEAEKEFKTSASLAPTAAAYSNLGALYIYQGRYGDAIGVMQRAIQLSSASYRKMHILWANLAEAYQYTPPEKAKALDAYRRAIQEVEKQLAFAPDDADLLSYAAVYWAKLGDRRQALDEIGRALSFAHGNRDVSFRAAIVYELRGERDRAWSALEDAIRGGYSLDEIEREPELGDLRQDDRFRQVLAAKANENVGSTKERK
jgi:eukaryotic-like serine/threonine-protein kinase